MKLDKSKRSSNIGKQGQPQHGYDAKANKFRASPHEAALIGAPAGSLVSPSMEKLRKIAIEKKMSAKPSKAISDAMDTAAKNDKMTNVANAIRRATGKGSINRNPFDKARNK